MINRYYRLFTILILALALYTPVIAGESLVIAGTGDSQDLLRAIAARFSQQHPEVTVEVPDSIGSGGGIKGVLAGRFSLGRTARSLKPSETARGMVEYPFALSPVVLGAHPTVTGVQSLSSTQIRKIFAGELTSWEKLGGPTHVLYAVDREPGDSSRRVLEQGIEGFKETTSAAKVFFSTPEAAQAIASHPYTVGFLPISVARAHGLKVLAIDGITPEEQNLISGRYPHMATLYLVSHGRLEGMEKTFVDYLYTDEAQSIIREFGLAPVEPSKT